MVTIFSTTKTLKFEYIFNFYNYLVYSNIMNYKLYNELESLVYRIAFNKNDNSIFEKIKNLINQNPTILYCKCIKYGYTLMHYAYTYKNSYLISLLLEENSSTKFLGIQSNEDMYNILHLACIDANVDIVQALIEYNSEPDFIRMKCINGYTPLHIVALHFEYAQKKNDINKIKKWEEIALILLLADLNDEFVYMNDDIEKTALDISNDIKDIYLNLKNSIVII